MTQAMQTLVTLEQFGIGRRAHEAIHEELELERIVHARTLRFRIQGLAPGKTQTKAAVINT